MLRHISICFFGKPYRILKAFLYGIQRDIAVNFYDAVQVVNPSGRNSCQSGWLEPRKKNNRFDGMICTIYDVKEREQAEEIMGYYNL